MSKKIQNQNQKASSETKVTRSNDFFSGKASFSRYLEKVLNDKVARGEVAIIYKDMIDKVQLEIDNLPKNKDISTNDKLAKMNELTEYIETLKSVKADELKKLEHKYFDKDIELYKAYKSGERGTLKHSIMMWFEGIAGMYITDNFAFSIADAVSGVNANSDSGLVKSINKDKEVKFVKAKSKKQFLDTYYMYIIKLAYEKGTVKPRNLSEKALAVLNNND